jgi:hypothetical protein
MRALSTAFLASALCVFAGQGPAESALDFVKKLGTGQVDLAPDADTAIVAEISPTKKESILHRLQRLALEFKGEEIEVGPTRVEGGLAGVILRMVDPADPMEVRVLSLAMVQDGETWRAAPVPASFENTVAAYSSSSRSIARQLELWLAREQANEVERLRESAGSLLRKSLAGSISPEIIQTWTAGQAISEFMDACEKRDAARIQVLLGGLSEPLPDDWQQLSSAVKNAVASPVAGFDIWALLTSPAVLRIPVWDEGENPKEVSLRMLFLDPRNDEAGSILEQILTVKAGSDGLWVVQVPESEPVTIGENEINRTLASHLARKYPSKPQASAEDLKNLMLASLRKPDSPHVWASFMHRGDDPIGDLGRYMRVAVIRWEAINPAKPLIPIELGFQQEADHAFLAMQWLSLGKLAYAPRVFHYQKNADGWVWNNSPDQPASAAAEKWVRQNEAGWKKSYLHLATGSCAMPDLSLPSPDVSEASVLVQEWSDCLAAENWHRALSLCAHLGTDKSPTLLLRNLGYECKSVQLGTKSPMYDILERGKTVTLVATRSIDQARSIQSLLPVVSTPAGPRILMEIDLGDPSRPGRSFLNRNALDRLSSVHPTIAGELNGMISKQMEQSAK